MEKDDEVKGQGNSYDFGGRIYDARVGRWLSRDAHEGKYASLNPYNFVANTPLMAIDPDGKDIIILKNSSGAHNSGHGAVLIGDNENGWNYISKDGFEGSTFNSKSKFVLQKFSSIEEFRNSPHNFVLAEGTHSTSEGKEAKEFNFKLNEKGEKIQRYDEALYIGTTQKDGKSTDKKAIAAAKQSAKRDYGLLADECSTIRDVALKASKDSDGTQLKDGAPSAVQVLISALYWSTPNGKYENIMSRNKQAIVYDEGIKPDDVKLQVGEKGVKPKKKK
jgi:RHS repeat-associated protein